MNILLPQNQKTPSKKRAFETSDKENYKPKRGRPRKIEKALVFEDQFQFNLEQDSKKVYCICKKNNKQKMIGCDNESCKIQWFHFKCVNLKIEPQGDWFCHDCSK